MYSKFTFSILLYISLSFVFMYYAQSFFKRKYSSVVTYLICAVGYSILYFFYLTRIQLLYGVAYILINVVLFTVIYDAKPLPAIFHSIGLLTMLVITEWIVIISFSHLYNKPLDIYTYNFNIYVTTVVLNKIFFYTIVILFARIFGKKHRDSAGNSFFWALMIFPIVSMVIVFVFNQISSEYDISDGYITAYIVSSVFMLFANIIIFLVYEYSLRNSNELTELRAVNQKEEIDRTYMQILEKNNNDLNVLTHDIKNHLELIGGISDDELISSYVKEIYGSVEKLGYAGISNNRMFDVLINKYITVCDNNNVNIEFDVKTANFVFITDFDLSTIINNLLDNAVRSAKSSKDKKISVVAYTKNKAFQVLCIKNSCDKLPLSNNKTLLTTNKNKIAHGYGTKSVIKTAEKYNGVFDWNYDENTHMFEVMVVLPLPLKNTKQETGTD